MPGWTLRAESTFRPKLRFVTTTTPKYSIALRKLSCSLGDLPLHLSGLKASVAPTHLVGKLSDGVFSPCEGWSLIRITSEHPVYATLDSRVRYASPLQLIVVPELGTSVSLLLRLTRAE